ncbi:MAG: hypothetical protein R2784_09140 [Saprospiraceae bacterium]
MRNFLYSNVTNVEHKGGWELEMEPKDEEATASHASCNGELNTSM